MSQLPEPIPLALPDDWTPAQAWAVHEILETLLEQIEAHYGLAVQHWLGGVDPDEDPFRDAQLDLFENDFDDPLLF
jgi:hypothetical protein